MSLSLSLPQDPLDIRPKISVIGVGGAGGNAVSNMIRAKLDGVDFIVANTDAQALQQSLCERRIQLGATVTRGLGAGARPDIGRAAAEEAVQLLAEQLAGSNMAFITAGMGGGTGTGAAPIVAQIAREQGILTVGVVTKPFHFEGAHRMRLAEAGIQELQQYVDTLIIIPNQNLFRIANEKTTFADAFKMADEVLHSGVRGVTDLMVMPGLINLDFADIRAVMSEMGKAMMGTGEASGENRAIAAAEAAISNPLLDEVSMKGAKGILINITGGLDMTLFEVDEAANRIRDEVDPDANIIFGSTFDQSLDGRIRISVVATGIEAVAERQARPMASLAIVARNAHPLPAGNPATAAPGFGVAAMAAGGHERAATASMTAAARPLPSGGMTMPVMGANALQPQPMKPVLKDEMAALDRIAAKPAPQPQAPLPEDRPFIAPPAVEPARLAVDSVAPVVADTVPLPVAEAPKAETPAMAPAPIAAPVQQPAGLSLGAERRRGPSLFEKMTSRFAGHAQAQRPAQPEPAMVQPQAPAPLPAARAEPKATRPEPHFAQPTLNLDPAERLASSRAEEEMLDIPAFLRRQAN